MNATIDWPATSPEGTLRRAFDAFVARDGHALAALASRASLDAYKNRVAQDISVPWEDPWTVDDYLRCRPDMPREVAEWERQQQVAQRANHTSLVLQRFGNVSSVEELLALDAPQLLHRVLELAPRGLTIGAEFVVLGHVREAPSTAYVVFRLRYHDPDGAPSAFLQPPEVATMCEENGEWRLELDYLGDVGMPGFRNVICIG